MTEDHLAWWLILWLVIAGALLFTFWRRVTSGGGLVLAFVMNLTILHWLGATVYLKDTPHLHDREIVVAGYLETLWGLAAFTAGCLLLAPLIRRKSPYQRSQEVFDVNDSLPVAYSILGGVAFLGLSFFLASIPTTTALVAAGQQLFVVGCCLGFWNWWQRGDRLRALRWMLLALVAPVATLVLNGFLGYGVAALVIVSAFASLFVRPKWLVFAGSVLVIYCGVSLFVTYFQQRDEIRSIVFGGAPLQVRFSQTMDKLWPIEWFDSDDPDHLYQLDERLNQNHLVGSAVVTTSATQEFARGETLKDAALALIPRAIWPEKPVSAGSGSLVTKYTNIYFAPGTSVGIGIIMELYVNFGTAGVVFGMFLLGTILGAIDIAVARRLERRDLQGFTLLFLVGISFLQVGGSLVEVTAGAASSVVAAFVVNKLLLFRFQRRKTIALGSVQESA